MLWRRHNFSAAWIVWSSAAESALVDAFPLAGAPLPAGELVEGRGVSRFRMIRQGGPLARKARSRFQRGGWCYCAL